jgi:aspartate/methionine/tyrosine aminotransferase
MHIAAPYMAWAKSRPHVGFDLALSNVLACTIDDLRDTADALDFEGHNDNGYPPLLDAIAGRYGVATDRIATAIGTSGANFLAALALVATGDDVLVESPVYDPLPGICLALGANVVRFERRFEDRFAIDPDRVKHAMTPRTRLVIVTHPHNPSGGVTPDEYLAAVARTAEANGAFVIVDEVYLDAARGASTAPAAQLAGNIVTTNSLTKSYGLAPLRCGWAIAAAPIAERVRRARDIVDGSGPIPAERLAVIAFSQLDGLAARAQAILQPNVAAFRAFLERTPALQGFVQHGTVAFPRLSSGRDSTAFADRLLLEHDTAVVPGRFFEAPSHFRVGLGISHAALTEGLARISALLDAGG